MTAETLFMHGGGFITWQRGSGLTGRPPVRIAPDKLQLSFNPPQASINVQHKASGTLLWPSPHDAGVIPGTATPADLTPPVRATRQISSMVVDASGRYLPRAFNLTLGVALQQEVALYASPLSTRFGAAGGVLGELRFQDGAVAAWSLLELTITPTLGGAMTFMAQADQHGDFCLALDRLPALTRDAPAPSYAATLRIYAQPSALQASAVDPSTLPPVDIAKNKNSIGQAAFAATLTLDITPGVVARVASPGYDVIVLRP